MWANSVLYKYSSMIAVALVVSMLMLLPSTATAQFLGQNRAVGGILVDPSGTVRQATTAEVEAALAELRQHANQAVPELSGHVELRKISLRGLEAAIQDALANNQGRLPDEILYLAGIQRIQYVLVYPDQNDIVLAGPGEGWKLDDEANVVGITTGQPVLRLEDLLVALRTVNAARTEGISVSIDPTQEGLQRFDAFMSNQKTFNRGVVAGLTKAMGPQEITYTGVPAGSHFARVLMIADHRMKRYAMNFEKSPLREIPGFLDLLKSNRRTPKNAMPRWWMACNYEPLARSEDRLAWELRGPGVKAMTEDEFVAADGTVQATGQQDPLATEWADRLTENYEKLAQKDPIFAELRNLMDMCVVAALIKKEDLTGLAGGGDFPVLTGATDGLAIGGWHAPQSVSTQCSYFKIGRKFVITASGGVQIESWQVASKSQVDGQLKEVHSKAVPTEKTWRWN